MTRTAFVTGATGFVGTNLVAALLTQQWRVLALVRNPERIAYLSRFNIELIEGDLDDAAQLAKRIPSQCDAVFHVAGDTSLWPPHRPRQYRTNVLGTRHMVQAALQQQVRRFIHTSSISAFGERDDVVDELSTPRGAESSIHYYQTKALAEQEVRAGISQGLPAVLINPCHILGPYDTANWARLFRLLKRGELPGIPPGTGMFCDVREVVDAHIAAVDKGRLGLNYFLGGEPIRFLDLMQLAADRLQVPCPTRTVPKWLLYLLGASKELIATITSEEPDITRESARIVCGHVRCNSDAAIRDLDYQITPVQQLVEDTLNWLQRESQL